MKSRIFKLNLLLFIALIGFTSCDSDDDGILADPTIEELLLDKQWNIDSGGFLRFNSSGIFVDTNLSGTWSWEKNDEEPFIIKADYGTFEIWYEFTDVTDDSLNFRASLTGPDEGYDFEGLTPLTSN